MGVLKDTKTRRKSQIPCKLAIFLDKCWISGPIEGWLTSQSSALRPA
jgi:hypothetical protein